MSRLSLVVPGFALVVLGALAAWLLGPFDGTRVAQRPNALLQGGGAPKAVADFPFIDETGAPRSLADFRGRYVLLNVWATWCVPCREEMPALDRLQAKLGGPGFTVLALSIDSGGVRAVKRFYAETGVRSLGVYVDPSLKAASALRIAGVPATILLDPQGREIGRHLGPAQWDSERALEELRGLTGS